MTPFFRFPHTPHLLWLGTKSPRDDKVLSLSEQADFLEHEVLLEEKIDGANTGISFDHDGNLLVQNRGAYLTEPFSGQYAKLGAWLKPRLDLLFDQLSDRYILFGEWCFARHSLEYTALPDWFVAFDLYDRINESFLDAHRRDRLADIVQVSTMPCLGRGRFEPNQLIQMVEKTSSQFRNGHLEGLVLRFEDSGKTISRTKIVRQDFVQSISDHWSHQAITPNKLVSTSGFRGPGPGGWVAQ